MKKIIKHAMALTVICLVCAGILALTNYFTESRIETQEAQQPQNAMRELIPEAGAFSDSEEHEIIDGSDILQATFYRAFDSKNNVIAYAFTTSASGYGGEIEVMTAIDLNAEVIGVKPLKLNETPGLGMKAQDNGFLSQFSGKLLGIKVSKSASGANEIQAITGATITSAAVTQAVNTALLAFDSVAEM